MSALTIDILEKRSRPRLYYSVVRRAGAWAVNENGQCAGAFDTREAALGMADALARDARGVGYDARVEGEEKRSRA